MFVQVRNLSIHVQLRGPVDGPALVLLHSIGTNFHLWDFQAEALADRFRVVQIDLRGHGLTTVPNGEYSMDELAADIVDTLKALSIDSAHICGVSLGGAVALAVAANAPSLVRSLILCDTAVSFAPADFWRERAASVLAKGLEWLVEPAMDRWVSETFRRSAGGDGMRAMLRRTDPAGYAGAAGALAKCDLKSAASALTIPALVVVGELDASTPVATAEALRDLIPGARLEVLPGRAHLPPMDGPDDLTRLIKGFLDGNASAAGQ